MMSGLCQISLNAAIFFQLPNVFKKGISLKEKRKKGQPSFATLKQNISIFLQGFVHLLEMIYVFSYIQSKEVSC